MDYKITMTGSVDDDEFQLWKDTFGDEWVINCYKLRLQNVVRGSLLSYLSQSVEFYEALGDASRNIQDIRKIIYKMCDTLQAELSE